MKWMCVCSVIVFILSKVTCVLPARCMKSVNCKLSYRKRNDLTFKIKARWPVNEEKGINGQKCYVQKFSHFILVWFLFGLYELRRCFCYCCNFLNWCFYPKWLKIRTFKYSRMTRFMGIHRLHQISWTASWCHIIIINLIL